MVIRFVACVIVAVCTLSTATQLPAADKRGAGPKRGLGDGLVRVNATSQPYDFIRPWAKKPPFSRRGLGAVLEDGRVLVTAELVGNATFVELEKGESGDKTPAEVQLVDYQANLALLVPSERTARVGAGALPLAEANVGDRVSVLQFESNGAVLSTDATVVTVEVGRYPLDDASLLLYRVACSLQWRDGSFTVPVVKDGKLVGVMMRYDSRSQSAEVIPSVVIRHFLKAAGTEPGMYRGFPRAGIGFSPMRDPQLRRYAKVPEKERGGVYITEVPPGLPADKAGVRAGDVLVGLGDTAVDQDGNYADPRYGRLALAHWISGLHFHGDTVTFKILRAGEGKRVDVVLEERKSESSVIEPVTMDRPPKYVISGGLVFQELSRQYLREWGDWQKKAPQRFVYYDRYQSGLFPEGDRKIVILTQVLPTKAVIGYEDLGQIVVAKVNGVQIRRISDLAEALKHPEGGFHKIELEEAPRLIYLDAAEASAADEVLKKDYGITALSRLE